MKKIILIFIALISMSYLPTQRYKNNEVYHKSDLVVIAKATKIIKRKEKIDNQYSSVVFYAVFDVEHTLNGHFKKQQIEVYVGNSWPYKTDKMSQDKFDSIKYKDSLTHNTQSRYYVLQGQSYLLELTKEDIAYSPSNYWNSIFRILQDNNNKVYFMPGHKDTATIKPLKEYELSRNVKLKLKNTEYDPNKPKEPIPDILDIF